MSKLPLAVCTFGLLFSPAFAQDKTPEQLREESSRIFGIEGLQTQTFTRFVAAGTKQRMGFYSQINTDCSAVGDIKVRVTKHPNTAQWKLQPRPITSIFQKKISALSAISIRLRACRSITGPQRNTAARMNLICLFSTLMGWPGNIIST
jgi:hypothetical protein